MTLLKKYNPEGLVQVKYPYIVTMFLAYSIYGKKTLEKVLGIKSKET